MKDLKGNLIYIAKRLVLMIFTFLVIFVICFSLIRMLPISIPGEPGSDKEGIFHKIQEALGREYLGSDGEYHRTPIIQQLFAYISNIISPGFDEGGEQLSRWGYAWKGAYYFKNPADILGGKLPATILINVYSMILSIPVGLALGIFMALKKNKWEDYVLSVVVMLLISVPSFVYAFLLQLIFAYRLKWVDPMVLGINEAGSWFAPRMFRSMILPVVSMSLGSIAGYSRYTRAELTEVLTSDFMLLARTKGLSRAQATVRHAFRNSLVPIFPMILGEVISVLSGSIIIETIFQINGVGSLFLDSINNRDYDLFQFVAMFYIGIGLVGGLLVDISYGLVDPRIRMGGRK